jgi:hypothetical protein
MIDARVSGREPVGGVSSSLPAGCVAGQSAMISAMS